MRESKYTTIEREKMAKELFAHPDDESIKLKLIKSWDKILTQVSNDLSTYNVPAEDMYMIGVTALLQCFYHVKTLPKYMDVYYSIYWKMRGQIDGHRYKQVYTVQNSVSTSNHKIKKEMESIIDGQSIDCDYRVDMLILRKYLYQLLPNINAHSEHVIDLYFGYPFNNYSIEKLENEELTNDLDISIQFSTDEIAKQLGVSRSRIGQIRLKALHDLRDNANDTLRNFGY